MRDPIREQVDLAADLGRVEWPAGEELRGIARRRTRRATLAASLSVILLVSGVWVVAARPFHPTPGTADLYGAAAAPAPTTIGPHDPAWIPPEALLSPEDVGPGLVAARVSTDQNQPVGNWAFTLEPCPTYQKVRTYRGSYQFRRQQTLEFPAKIAGRPETATAVLQQTVMRLPGDGARQLVAEAFEAATICPKYVSATLDEGGVPAKRTKVRTTHAWSLVDRGFAGDESLLFEHRMTAMTGTGDMDLGGSAVLVVRVGDLVATVEQVNGDKPTSTRRLGTRAAAWLCAAATPPC